MREIEKKKKISSSSSSSVTVARCWGGDVAGVKSMGGSELMVTVELKLWARCLMGCCHGGFEMRTVVEGGDELGRLQWWC